MPLSSSEKLGQAFLALLRMSAVDMIEQGTGDISERIPIAEEFALELVTD